MWPLLLDMTKEESIQNLRNLELEAYSHLVSALRAQGPLNSDKRKLLKDTGYLLNITQERHKAEIRRAVSDERLNTIAYHVCGTPETLEDWVQEGRRLVPLLARTAPQTAYSALADEVADAASQCNKQLPPPNGTERKRSSPSASTSSSSVVQLGQSFQQQPSIAGESSGSGCNKTASFRIPDPPSKPDDSKKRKLSSSAVATCQENSSLSQQLISPKLCRIQQLYRQRLKPKPKDHRKPESEHLDLYQHKIIQPVQQIPVCSQQQQQYLNQKVNVLQNITLQPINEEDNVETDPNLYQPSCTNENQAPKPKILMNAKPNITKPGPGPSNETQKALKIPSSKKPITKTVNSGQKLIVVSNAQTLSSNSILQRTLQIPFPMKNVSIKNLEKFKLVTNNSTPTTIHVTNVTSVGNSVKHKVVTVKTTSTGKKVFPLSHVQVLNSKGSIKVLPLGGKIVGKSLTTAAATTASPSSSSLYVVNASPLQPQLVKTQPTNVQMQGDDEKQEEVKEYPVTTSSGSTTNSRENGEAASILESEASTIGTKGTSVSEEATVVVEGQEDYDTKIEEFHIPQENADIMLEEDKQGSSEGGQRKATLGGIKDEDYRNDTEEQVNSMEALDDTMEDESTLTPDIALSQMEECVFGNEQSEISCEVSEELVYQIDRSKTSDIEHD